MLDNRIPPPVLALLIGLGMWLGAADAVAATWRVAVAGGLFLMAGAFGVPALRAFRLAGTTIDPVRLDRTSAFVTGGVYRVTRNPMYVSLVLMLAAWATWLGGPWAWAGPAILAAWLDRFQIRPEERAMAAGFGEDYARYAARVRRWI